MKKTTAILVVLLILTQSVMLVRAWDVERPDHDTDLNRTIHPTGSSDGNAAVAMGVTLRNYDNHSSEYGESSARALAIITTLIGVSAGVVFTGLAKMRGFLTSVARWIVDRIQGNDRGMLSTMHGFGLNFFNITTLAFMIIDFSCMVFQIRMFVDSIV